jgi:hypothetical protein
LREAINAPIRAGAGQIDFHPTVSGSIAPSPLPHGRRRDDVGPGATVATIDASNGQRVVV